jgi:DNA mismatch endonuclease (patch repair protein)
MDKIDKVTRSKNMAHIRAKNTSPELQIRKRLSVLGFRYRIHYLLPGKPDIVFPSKKAVIFINGCFWHGHGCKLDHKPKSNVVYWNEKISKNKERDIKNHSLLKKLGWKVVVLWECKISTNLDNSISKIFTLLS